ncbi:MAG: transketolase [Anaerovoracaceae bacterium]|nr:transketolase [Anaerovoracaceae bacterium]
MEISELKKVANDIRIDIIKSVHAAGSGHPGGSLSAAEIVTALYFEVMNIDPKNPEMKGRDKFILSKGHANPAQYAALAERGFFPKEELLTLRKLGSSLQGHPNMHYVPGIEMSTGSLGQGLSVAVGMALANRLDSDPGRIYTLHGDGEIQEGMIWEAAMAAVHYKLDNITAIIDWNGLQIDGRNEDVMSVAPIGEKFRGFGWNVIECDGNDIESVINALNEAKTVSGVPTVVIAKTTKGKGVSYMEDQAGWHGKAPDDEQYELAVNELGGEL